MDINKETIGLLDAVCPVCNKNFYYSPEYVYTILIKKRRKHVCSWACLRKYEKENNK